MDGSLFAPLMNSSRDSFPRIKQERTQALRKSYYLQWKNDGWLSDIRLIVLESESTCKNMAREKCVMETMEEILAFLLNLISLQVFGFKKGQDSVTILTVKKQTKETLAY